MLRDFKLNLNKNKLELLALVYISIEKIQNYVYGIEFEVVSDHEALMTILRDDRANKTFSSRLTSWVDRLLPFQFKVVHAPDRTMGAADCLSRHLSERNSNESVFIAEELWHNWFTVNEMTRNESLIKMILFEQITEGRAHRESQSKSSWQNQASWQERASNAKVKMTQVEKWFAKQIQQQLNK